MQETRVWFLSWEDPQEKGMAIQSSILAWRIPWTEELDTLQSMSFQRVGQDWVANTFTSFMYGYESWTIKKAEHQRIDADELWCQRRLLRVPWTARRSNQSILKEISPEYSLEGLMLKVKLQYFGHLMRRTFIGKDPDAGKDWRWKEKGMTEDEMVGWHHQVNDYEFD